MSGDFGDRVVRGIRWIAVGRASTQMLTWVVTILVMRLLSPDDYGMVSLTGVFVMYASIVSELGLGAALIQSRLTSLPVLRSVLGATLLISVGCSVALIALSGSIAEFFREPNLKAMVQFAALQFPIAALGTVPYALLAQKLQYREISLASVVSTIAQCVCTLILAKTHPGPWALLIGTFVGTLTRVAVLMKYQPVMVLPSMNIGPLRPLLRNTLYNFSGRSLWFWYGEFDSFLIGRRLGAYELGAYSTAKLLAFLPLDKAMDIINQISFPAFSAISSDLDRLQEHYHRTMRITAVYAFSVFWGFAVVAPDVTSILLDEKWQSTAGIVGIFSLVIPFRMLTLIGSPLLLSLGRGDQSIRILCVAFVATLTGVLLGSSWGLIGVTIGWCAAAPVVWIYSTTVICRVVGSSWGRCLLLIRGASFAGGLMAVLLEFSVEPLLREHSALVRVAVEVPVGACCYFLFLRIFDHGAMSETIEMCKRLLNRNQ